jgi:uncharacterized protein (TIGR00661 family)
LQGLRYFAGLGGTVRRLATMIRDEQPDLAITDFEPALPRAARRTGLPFLSLDHQHFLTTSDLSSLPSSIGRQVALMAAVVHLYYRGQIETLVSSFYHPPLRRGCRGVRRLGVMLRPEILALEPERAGHLVAYFRRFATDQSLHALRATGRKVHVYGLGDRPREGRLHFRAVSESAFLEDLAAADALVTTAGNQIVGEAMWLGKPVLAMPERNNYEQYVNAHYLQESGAGIWKEIHQLTAEQMIHFVDRLDRFRPSIDRNRLSGNSEVLSIIESHLADRLVSSTIAAANPVTA